jgi:hypothetical protein
MSPSHSLGTALSQPQFLIWAEGNQGERKTMAPISVS